MFYFSRYPKRREPGERQSKIFKDIWKELAAHQLWEQLDATMGLGTRSDRIWSNARKKMFGRKSGFEYRTDLWLWEMGVYFCQSEVIQTMPTFKHSAKLAEQYNEWIRLVKAVHGALLYDDFCFVCERPTVLTPDNESRWFLHNESGPGLQYRDGFSVYSWHSHTIGWDQAFIIEQPARIKLAHINSEIVAETREIMIKRSGLKGYRIKNGFRPTGLHKLFWSIAPKLPSDFEPYGQRSRLTDAGGDCSGNCKHFQVLQAMPLDWGVCVNRQSPRCGLLTFEHQGCYQYEMGEPLKDDELKTRRNK